MPARPVRLDGDGGARAEPARRDDRAFGVEFARFIGAAAHGAIFAVVPVAAASLARRGAEAKSVASAFLGASVGVVAGPPFVAAVSDHLGWRVASGIIAAIALGVAIASQLKLPPLEPEAPGESSRSS